MIQCAGIGFGLGDAASASERCRSVVTTMGTKSSDVTEPSSGQSLVHEVERNALRYAHFGLAAV